MAEQQHLSVEDDNSHIDTSTRSARPLSSPGVQSSLSSRADYKILETVEDIQNRREQVLNRYANFKEATYKKRIMLLDAQKWQCFRRDGDEQIHWINEKLKQASDFNFQDTTNLQTKIQKHQAFEAEVLAHRQSVEDIETRGRAMISDGHYSSNQIQDKLEEISMLWKKLLEALKLRYQRLHQAWEFVLYNRQADEMLYWINDKSTWITTHQGDLGSRSESPVPGSDVSHVEVLQKKFDDFHKDLVNQEQKVTEINDTANSLSDNSHPRTDDIRAKQDEVNKAWHNLRSLAASGQQKLAGAHEVQQFGRDADEAMHWMNEKDALLDDVDPPMTREVAPILTLQRKLEGIERDLGAIKENVGTLNSQAQTLKDTHPESAEAIDEKSKQVEAKWNAVVAKKDARKEQLNSQHDYVRFFADYNDLNHWCQDIKQQMNVEDISKDVPSAEAMCERHRESLNEIEARRPAFAATAKLGNKLKDIEHPWRNDVDKSLVTLGAQKEDVELVWNSKDATYQQALSFHIFCREVEQYESMLAKNEAFLASEDVGDSLDSVEALLKKHNDFEKSIQAHEEKFRLICERGDKLIADENFASDEIRELLVECERRRDSLLAKAAERKTALEEAYKFQEFDRECDENRTWINEKLRILADDPMQDKSNLAAKQQKQAHIEAEIAPNQQRIEKTKNLGAELIASGNHDDKIKQRIAELDDLWNQLLDAVKQRKYKLKQLEQSNGFGSTAEDAEQWLSEVASQLRNDDIGKDLTQNRNLQRKMAALENEITQRRTTVNAVQASVAQFDSDAHPDLPAMTKRANEIQDAYDRLNDPLVSRKQRLADAEKFHELTRDIEDEMDWIKEKLPVASSNQMGRDLIAAQNLLKKHKILMNEIENREPHIDAVKEKGSNMILAQHFAHEEIKKRLEELKNVWDTLKSRADQRLKDLEDSNQAHQYFADANEAESSLREKEPTLANQDFGKDEDSCEALLKQHEAVMSDLEAFKATIDGLRTQADECANRSSDPLSSGNNAKQLIQVQHDHKGTRTNELTIRKGEILTLLNSSDKDWWKSTNSDGRQGYVPATYVKLLTEKAAADPVKSMSVTQKQANIEGLYNRLMDQGTHRGKKLEDATRAYQLMREASDIDNVLNERHRKLNDMSTEGTLEDVEKQKKQFDDIEKEIVVNKKRCHDMESAAINLERLGQNESAGKIRNQLQTLSTTLVEVEEIRKNKASALESSHEVQRYHRDANETEDWIHEKHTALNNDNVGNDLTSVQALRRKHEGLERDLHALNEKIKELDGKAAELMDKHPDQKDEIFTHQTRLNEQWNDLTDKANNRKNRLLDSFDLQRYYSDYRDLTNWINQMMSLVSSDELAKDVSGAEALLERHQENETSKNARSGTFHNFENFGHELLQAGHYASDDIQAKRDELNKAREKLEQAWVNRREQLDQCLELQFFNRDCEQAEMWMHTREQFLKGEETPEGGQSNVESLIKKHEDFDRAIKVQEDKIKSLVQQADQMIAADHYGKDEVVKRREALLKRWDKLKADLVDDRSKLGEAKDLQGVLQDIEAMEIWMNEMIRKTGEEQFRDPTNVQSKYQKHQVFQAEIAANSDRLKSLLNTGQALIDENKCGGHENAVKEKLDHLHGQWDNLVSKSKEVEDKVSVAMRQQIYNAGMKDIEFWLGEMEGLVSREEYGKDLPSVQQLVKRHQMIQSDITAHGDRLKEAGQQAEELAKSDAPGIDHEGIRAKQADIQRRYTKINALAAEHGAKLDESLRLYQFLRDIDDQEAWVKQKKLLVASDDHGRDLTSVQNLIKKHKRLENEIEGHEQSVQNVKDLGEKLCNESNIPTANIEQRLQELLSVWTQLKQSTELRRKKLDESLKYQEFVAGVEEEEAWIGEKQHLLSSDDCGKNLSAVQGLLKKHDAVEVDAETRKKRFDDIQSQGDSLVGDGNFNEDLIRLRTQRLQESLQSLRDSVSVRKGRLVDNSAFLQFMWKANVVDRWIADKEVIVRSEDPGKDLSSVQTMLTKQETFDTALKAFDRDGIKTLTALKERLISSKHTQSPSIQKRYDAVMQRWNQLQADSNARRERLLRLQDQFRQLDDLFLSFAKKASGFSSWFENAEEDLTDPVRCNSMEEIKTLIESHEHFKSSLTEARADFTKLEELDHQISSSFKMVTNPYTWFDMKYLRTTWDNLIVIIRRRDDELKAELARQQQNDAMRKEFAVHANDLHARMTAARSHMMEANGTLEEQLAFIKDKAQEIRAQQNYVRNVEELGAQMQAQLILDNRYTEQSALSISQQWDQLNQLAMRLQHNLEQQLQARNQSGVSEVSLREFSMMFKYFDKDRTGYLSHQHFKQCLQALGIDVSLSDDDTECQAILDRVDPNRDNQVPMQDYMEYLIGHETENVQSVREIEQAFTILTHEGKRPYITKQELFANLTPEQSQYCIAHMRKYIEPNTNMEIKDAYDYSEFTRRLFVS